MVPRAQYEELLRKYQELNRKMYGKDQNKKPVENMADPKIVMESGQGPLVETVSVFGEDGLVNKKKDAGKPEDRFTDDIDKTALENDISKLRNAENLIYKNQFDGAMKVLYPLEKSHYRQIKVRSKYLIGELLFRQKEYDLALQVFEEIISNYAFSGIVIKALEKIVNCADKLQLVEKKERYQSMLKDVFNG